MFWIIIRSFQVFLYVRQLRFYVTLKTRSWYLTHRQLLWLLLHWWALLAVVYGREPGIWRYFPNKYVTPVLTYSVKIADVALFSLVEVCGVFWDFLGLEKQGYNTVWEHKCPVLRFGWFGSFLHSTTIELMDSLHNVDFFFVISPSRGRIRASICWTCDLTHGNSFPKDVFRKLGLQLRRSLFYVDSM